MLLPILLLAQTQYFSVPPVDAPELARFGPHDVMIEKPFEARTLLDRVRQALDN